ncbi:MAG: HEAT repeat domain-containing protein [Aeoliella sp.]
MNPRCTLLLAVVAHAILGGCHSAPWSMGLFAEHEKSTYRTATMRIDAIREFAARSTKVDTPEQREITNQLARQIQVEPDPLVREAIVASIAEFRTPLAMQVLEAGMQDSDVGVRGACCLALGRRGDASGVPLLARVIESESDVDVRLSAVDALGSIDSPESVAALAIALEDSNPAMQFAGVRSMQAISDREYGGDVASWLQYAKGNEPTPTDGAEISVAGRLRQLSPF